MNLRRRRRAFFVPLNAMSDVAFLLLIFIMLVSLTNYRKELKIEYPEAKAAGVSGERNLEIGIDRAGALYLNGSASSLKDIEFALAGLYQSAPGTRVHVIADRNTRFEQVRDVITILQLLQYRAVSFVVKDS